MEGNSANSMCSWTLAQLQMRFSAAWGTSWTPPLGFSMDSFVSDVCCHTCLQGVPEVATPRVKIPDAQYNAMMALRNATGGATFGADNLWQGPDPCGWYGVECDAFLGVHIIWPIHADMAGTLPSEIGNLTGAMHATRHDWCNPLPGTPMFALLITSAAATSHQASLPLSWDLCRFRAPYQRKWVRWRISLAWPL